MSIPRTKKPQRAKAAPKPERTDGPCCTGCGKATDHKKAAYVMPSMFPEVAPTEYACSKSCYDIWIARDPSRGSKTAAKWA